MRWLHGIRDDRHKIISHLLQVELVAQRRGKGLERSLGVVFTPIEAAIDELLCLSVQRLRNSR